MSIDRKKLRARLEALAYFDLSVSQDDQDVRGNALASGDDAEDKRVEDAIIERLDNGDVWAWAHVIVSASFNDFVGSDSLGCCSYEDADDFKGDGYYADMKDAALDELTASVAEALEELGATIADVEEVSRTLASDLAEDR